MPGRQTMPSALRRSPAKAQRTWVKAHDNAVRDYGEGERAHRTAYAALKHSFEKVGDRWAPKARRGPSDPRARGRADAARRGKGETFGGLDYYGNTRAALYERAARLEIPGRSRMSKKELARAIARKQ
ncbi:MAG TPA: ChaB family protein [Burkholderiales bacterium]|nr:ChaB family protein [Burkholderiales bacterium]